MALVVVASPVAAVVGRITPLEPGQRVLIERTGAGSEDERMSRRHATVELDADEETLIVTDGYSAPDGWRNSTNGTWVDGVAIQGPTRITTGGWFRTGGTAWLLAVDPVPQSPESLLIGVSEPLGTARAELELVTTQVARRLDRGERVTQSLLVTGPRGSGKQVVAQEAHRLLTAKRKGKAVPLRSVTGPALADGTGAADLFGVVEKYATDVKARKGHFQLADGGVLFLDEIGDLPLPEQAKLLTVLQEREVLPLGATHPVAFEALIIAATNRDLPAMVASGQFRADLLDRLSRFTVHMPELDERPEDIAFLARALLARAIGRSSIGTLSTEAIEALLGRSWPGNVRELDGVLERAAALAHHDGLDLPNENHIGKASPPRDPSQAREVRRRPTSPTRAVENRAPRAPETRARHGWPAREELEAVLIECGWNKTEVARRYGKHPRQVTRWMEYLDVEEPTARTRPPG